MSARTVVVLQPGYLPWLGFFDQLREADVFVYYDDVQYDKHGWRNRNRVKSPSGEPLWLTVPVRTHGLERPRVDQVEIDAASHWARRHAGTLRQCYARAPFAKPYLPELEELLSRPWARLVDLDLAAVELVCRWLGLSRRIERASALGAAAGDEDARSGRLIALCKRFEATRYFSGGAARDYLDVDAFARAGIAVEFQDYRHPVYPQLHGAFVPYLSIVDLVFNCGPESMRLLSGSASAA